MAKLIVSDTIWLDATAPWGNAEVMTRQRAHARIAQIKARTRRDILVIGSHVLWNDLLAHGLPFLQKPVTASIVASQFGPAFANR